MIVTCGVNSTLFRNRIILYDTNYTIFGNRIRKPEKRKLYYLRLRHTMYHEQCEGQKFATSSSQNYNV